MPILLLISFALHAQAQLVTGKLVDDATGLPVEGAVLTNGRDGSVAWSDATGKFSIKAWPTDTLVVSASGYAEIRIRGGETGGALRLSPKVVELRSLVLDPVARNNFRSVSALDISLRPTTSSQDVLRLVPGLFIGQHAGGGKAEQLFLRGFDIDHGTDINITVDGVPVNMVSHAHGQGYADLHYLIPELINKVDFRKGPYDVDRGNFATAGYVDFQTRTSVAENIVKVEAGQFGTFRAVGLIEVLGKKKQADESLLIAPEYMYTRGYFDHPQNFNRFNFFTKYTRALGRSRFSVSGSAFHSKWKASGQIPERALQAGLIGFFGAIDPNEGGNTGRYQLNTQLLTRLSDRSSVTQQAYYVRYDFTLFSNFTFYLNNPVDGDQIRQVEKRNLAGYSVKYSTTSYAGNTQMQTTVGAGLRYDQTDDSELSRTRERVTVITPVMKGDVHELNAYAWIGQSARFSRKFSMDGGLRFDQFRSVYKDKLQNERTTASAGIVSPKINFNYQAAPSTRLYVSLGRGFHSNDTRVVVQTGGREVLPAAYGTDIGFIIKPARNVMVQSALWYLKLDQEFVYVGDEGIVEPGGRSRRMGVDLSLRYQPFSWMHLDLDANYSHGRAMDEPKEADRLPLAPVVTSIGGITVNNQRGWSGSLRYRWMGDRPANEDNSIIAEGYVVADMLLQYRKKKWEATVSVQNIFDVRWKETQFDTESKLAGETDPVSEIHFTPGTPFFAKAGITWYF